MTRTLTLLAGELVKKLSSQLVFGLEAFEQRHVKVIEQFFVQFVQTAKSTTLEVNSEEGRPFNLFLVSYASEIKFS